MFSLNDKLIREALLKRLSNFTISPRTIIQELRIHNGNVIAEVVTVHSYPHCYEIKGLTPDEIVLDCTIQTIWINSVLPPPGY